jgi:hypothetical protein
MGFSRRGAKRVKAVAGLNEAANKATPAIAATARREEFRCDIVTSGCCRSLSRDPFVQERR